MVYIMFPIQINVLKVFNFRINTWSPRNCFFKGSRLLIKLIVPICRLMDYGVHFPNHIHDNFTLAN